MSYRRELGHRVVDQEWATSGDSSQHKIHFHNFCQSTKKEEFIRDAHTLRMNDTLKGLMWVNEKLGKNKTSSYKGISVIRLTQFSSYLCPFLWLYKPYWITQNMLPAMVSAFGQPEFTVTIIAMWCHVVWNPASHLTEGKRKNSSNTAARKASWKKRTRSRWLLLAYRESTRGEHVTRLWKL